MFLKRYSIPKMILSYLISVITFIVLDMISVMALSLIFSILLLIPAIGSVISFIFSLRGDSATIFTLIISIIISSVLTNKVVFALEKYNHLHQRVTFCGVGITLIIIGIVFAILNLINQTGNPILNNILWVITGLYFFCKGRSIDISDV